MSTTPIMRSASNRSSLHRTAVARDGNFNTFYLGAFGMPPRVPMKSCFTRIRSMRLLLASSASIHRRRERTHISSTSLSNWASASSGSGLTS